MNKNTKILIGLFAFVCLALWANRPGGPLYNPFDEEDAYVAKLK